MRQSPRLLLVSVPLWLALVSVALVAGCGFQLRSEESLQLPSRLSPMQVTGLPTSDPLYRELKTALADAGVTVTQSQETARSFLVLSDREARRRVLAVNSLGKAIEYEIVEEVTFELLDHERNVLLPEHRTTREGSYTDPTGDPLGKAAEQQLLRESKRRDLVQQIMVRLRYGTR